MPDALLVMVFQDKKYKKKVLQAKMGDLQNKLGEIDPERSERSLVPAQPSGLQQQYYQKVVPQGAGQPAQQSSDLLSTKREGGKRGGFFTSLKRLVPTKKDNAVASTDELNQTLQLLETIDRRTKSREPMSSRSATPAGTEMHRQNTASAEASSRGDLVSAPAAGVLNNSGSVRKSRSRASFQLQSAAPVSRPAGLPADPHDGGPHEDVKDMATYLRLDPQRDYRFMWVSQVRYPPNTTPRPWVPCLDSRSQLDFVLLLSSIPACNE
jgi:hypothetical protein|eukprot:COSAG02_NODE_10181_length_2000_cov_2.042083_2_plen_267_part_00